MQPYFSALRKFQKGAMLKEEKVCREKLGIVRFNDETYQRLEQEAKNARISRKWQMATRR